MNEYSKRTYWDVRCACGSRWYTNVPAHTTGTHTHYGVPCPIVAAEAYLGGDSGRAFTERNYFEGR